MASDFPSLTPSSRVFTPGSVASSNLGHLSGEQTAVRHSSVSYGHRLRMTFVSVTRAQQQNLVSHFAFHGHFEPFDLPTETLVATNLTFPTGYQWRYAESPEIEEVEGQINMSVSLELLPPYTI
tara:strand:- start:1965 stop:2336 length:372 start_codon:yes stop_codon:yes gene_type:complete